MIEHLARMIIAGNRTPRLFNRICQVYASHWGVDIATAALRVYDMACEQVAILRKSA